MLEFPRWKYVLILLVLALAALYALPNAYQKDPAVQITANRNAPLDEALRGKVVDALKQAGLSPKSVAVENGSLIVRMTNLADQAKANTVLREGVGENYTVALNLASTVPAWLSKLGGQPMVLGLDLQGGVHFALQVDQKAALDKRIEAYVEDIRVALRDKHLRFSSVVRRPDNSLVVTLEQAGDAKAARDALAASLSSNAAGGIPTPLTYDIRDNQIVVGLPASDLAAISGSALEQNITTLRNRVNELGVAEPIIQRQGEDRIVVELPGVQDTAAAKRMIGATATLEYRAVIGDYSSAAEAQRSGNVPPEAKLYTRRDNGAPVLLSKRVIVTGDQMVTASTTTDQNGSPAVAVTLNNVGGQRMFDFTSANVNKPMAVVYTERIPEVKTVDGQEVRSFRVKEEVISVANVNSAFGKNFITTGLEKNEADGLSKLLRAGSLAAPMDFVEEYVIGPSLGAENVARGIKAVVFSFLFTLVFFSIYYRVFGLITSFALLFNLLIVVAVMSLFGATMTLPGFAGLALSVGLSVDANVLINERIREELRLGLPPKAAIAAGYDRAGGTILDANLTGLIVGVALYAFGTGPLKGFALTMIIGIFASMFTAITVSRALATLIYGRRKKIASVAI
ncbi:MAG TPA: protein translocase subunit SecD [Xanthomonadaceae bacterium]|nr:protein translocase subunit SecD [Xanthomonadaceae bacterium]